jgi:hypothetical protein
MSPSIFTSPLLGVPASWRLAPAPRRTCNPPPNALHEPEPVADRPDFRNPPNHYPLSSYPTYPQPSRQRLPNPPPQTLAMLASFGFQSAQTAFYRSALAIFNPLGNPDFLPCRSEPRPSGSGYTLRTASARSRSRLGSIIRECNRANSLAGASCSERSGGQLVRRDAPYFYPSYLVRATIVPAIWRSCGSTPPP